MKTAGFSWTSVSACRNSGSSSLQWKITPIHNRPTKLCQRCPFCWLVAGLTDPETIGNVVLETLVDLHRTTRRFISKDRTLYNQSCEQIQHHFPRVLCGHTYCMLPVSFTLSSLRTLCRPAARRTEKFVKNECSLWQKNVLLLYKFRSTIYFNFLPH
jgi:hypothetical protein